MTARWRIIDKEHEARRGKSKGKQASIEATGKGNRQARNRLSSKVKDSQLASKQAGGI